MGRFKQFLLESVNSDEKYLELAGDPDSNKGELEKMVRNQSIKMGYDSPKVYHGTLVTDTIKTFKSSLPRFADNFEAIYFTDRKEVTGSYGSNIYEVFIKTIGILEGSPEKFIQDKFGLEPPSFSNLKEWQSFREGGKQRIKMELQKEGYQGVNTKGEYIIFEPELIKSADPVTYDDQGNIIPLSKRFDDSTSDIRY